MNPSRILPVAVLAIVVAAMLAPPLPAAPAPSLPGSTWSVPGTMMATVSAEGQTEKFKGPVDVLFRFGPQTGLFANEFQMMIDDGVDTLVFGGAYVIDGKGKPQLTLSESSAAAGFLDLWDNIVDDIPGGSSLPTPEIDIAKAKLKAKSKAKNSGDTLKLTMSSKWYLDFFAPQHVRVKMKLSLGTKRGLRVS